MHYPQRGKYIVHQHYWKNLKEISKQRSYDAFFLEAYFNAFHAVIPIRNAIIIIACKKNTMQNYR